MGVLEGKVALVTGAGDGMGRAHARLMAERGADVIVLDVNEAGARETADTIARLGRRVLAEACDISDISAMREVVTRGSKELGRIDILVNNAGHGQRSTFEEITEADFDRMFAVHVKGSFFAAQAVIPGMKERRYGKIINISSIWGQTGAEIASHYCGAKAALLGLTKAWAKELAPWNIHVNSVAPGAVLSGGPLKFDSPERLKEKTQLVPLKRYAQPGELAYAVAFLASPEADFITGQVLSVNGGQTIV
jgi:3-oxoacyl-[acyl-carrier protein] reductase